ncbi:MAG: hypothetical protein KKA61_03415, partial [Nanoarchaeota archaeon]|nr:hypothetical protein [Nanoarchaeota archaeon]
LTEEIEKYVKIVKRNNGVIKNNLRELSNEKNSVFDKSVDEFIVDSKAVEKRVKEAFYSSITGKDVQQSYVTKINNDPHLSEQARNVSERRRKKTTAEFEALEKAKKLNNSIFASSKYPNNKS